jgi:hypothetical protein
VKSSMLAWIVILSFWVMLSLLILHDATKDDREGSALSVAAKRLGAFIDRAVQKIPNLWKSSASERPTKAGEAVAKSSSFSKPIQPGAASLIERAPAARKSWRKGGRVSATIPELELAIAEAVKKAAPECEEFVGVVLQHMTPRSRRGVNWQVRGVKFGKADRAVADEALATIIERMQQEFYLSEH